MRRFLPNIFYYLTITVICLCLTTANAQNEWTQKCSQKVSAKEVRLDMLGNIYLTNENSLQKRSICQAESVVYQFPTNGKNMIVDPSNPFKILLFFPNNRRLVFLNNFLSTLNEESLPDFLMSEDILLMCHSHNNSFWLYNSSQHTLVRYQSNFRRIHETPLQNIVRAPSLIPNQMFETDEQLFMGIPNYGVLVFDKFGGFKKRIPILYSDFFRYYAGKFYFFKENSLYGYDPVSFEEQALFNSENKILSFDIAKKNIVFLNENQELIVYEIP
jgi:hypothetical protein